MKYLVQSRLGEHRVVDVDAQNSSMAAHILMTEQDPADLPAEVSSYTSPDKDAWVSLGKKSFTKMTDSSPAWLEAFSETVSRHGLREPMTNPQGFLYRHDKPLPLRAVWWGISQGS